MARSRHLHVLDEVILSFGRRIAVLAGMSARTERRNSTEENKVSHLNLNFKATIWWEEKRPNVIKICTGDPRFVNDEGGKPGLWIAVRRSGCDRNNWNRLARALADAGQPAPPLMP